MPRTIFTILDDLQSNLAELGEALNPLKALTGVFKGGDGPFPRKSVVRRRGPGKKRAASSTSAATTASTAAPAKTKVARKPARTSKGTAARLALQGSYMSALRKLSKADQADVKKVRAEQGFEAAIKAAAEKAS
jgi:hypothetical protein